MKSLYPALVLLALSPSAPAAFLSPADRDSIEQQQQQLLRQNQQQRDALERAIPFPDVSRPGEPAPVKGPCFTIHTIVLDGVTLMTSRQQQKLLAPLQNQCLDMARITRLTNEISDWYISRVTSPAVLF
ncbi:polypeptide-transport-associated domain-containing protein ShlB-type [Klebsiella pneumoniae]|nr:polypeptide-transport-associated domain-containing protein ShlB-type [Klebsiella pneumoniae]